LSEEKPFMPTVTIRGSGSFMIPGSCEGRIAGSGKISGDEITVHGYAHLPGGMKTRRIVAHGSADFDGTLNAESMESSGSASIEGDVTIKNGIRCRGVLNVRGNVSAASLDFGGSLRIQGALKTESFEGKLGENTSRIENGITSERIHIETGDIGWNRSSGKLVTSNIIGGDIYLENVVCDNINGRRVTLGSGCKIMGEVTYTESVEVHSAASLFHPPKRSS
jgi:cytoskeletal protein CcmA (bactofilin family)